MTKIRNIKQLESYKALTKSTTRPVIDRIIGLYKKNEINIATAEKLAYQTIGRGKAPQTALKRIEGYESKHIKPQREITRTYFVSGRAQIKRTYYTKKSIKEGKPVKYPKVYHDEERVNITVQARSRSEAIEKAKKYELYDASGGGGSKGKHYEKEEDIVDIVIEDVIEEGQYDASDTKDRLMKSAKPVKYDFIPSDESY